MMTSMIDLTPEKLEELKELYRRGCDTTFGPALYSPFMQMLESYAPSLIAAAEWYLEDDERYTQRKLDRAKREG